MRCDSNSPLALIASGSSNYELSLVNLFTGDVEALLTVDDSRNKDNINSFTPIIP